MGKFCGKCGKEMEDNASFCTNCGTSSNGESVQKVEVVNNEPNPSNGMAIAGFVLSFFVPLLGLIFSIVGLNKSNQLGGSGRGLAKAGLILSIIWLVLEVIALVIYYLFVVAAVVNYY